MSNITENLDIMKCLYTCYQAELPSLVERGERGWALYGIEDGAPYRAGIYGDFAEAEMVGEDLFTAGQFIVQCIQDCDDADYSSLTLVP